MKMVTVASYDITPPAHIAMGRLRAEGIPCALMDEHLVQTDWLYSIAVGGIKLQVPPEYEARAKHILAADYSAELDDTNP